MKYSALPLLILALFLSCRGKQLAYETGDPQSDEKIQSLLSLLEEGDDETCRYGVMEQIISLMRKQGASGALKKIITDYLVRFPGDSYNGYYLLLLGTIHEEEGNSDIGAIYYNRLLKNYEDLIIRGQSLHHYSLNKLLKYYEGNSLQQIRCLKELAEGFSGEIDRGRIYYRLAKACEAEGLWNESITYYEKFLESPETTVPGAPNVYNEVRHYLNFHESDKSWTRENLEDLVNSIKYAIRTRNGARLNRYLGEDFFMMSWGQDRYDLFTEIPMNLSHFLKSSVWYRKNLDPASNNHEAFLETGGWSYRINIWYLYFNRVFYPVDPEINNRWEWAGIYFGNRL